MKHKFVRYGGANRIKQKGYNPHIEGFHKPPAPKGIYAFPLVAQELFLIGGKYDGLEFKEKLKRRREFTLSPSTQIWHHLIEYTNKLKIIAVHNTWVKTTVEEWYKAFKKQSLNDRYGNDSYTKIRNINEPFRSGISGLFSKDHYEVFFEEKI